MFAVVFNPASVPTTIDREGHTVPGRSWAPAATDDPHVATAVDAGRLLVVPDRPGDGDEELDPAYRQARDRVRDLNTRVEQLQALTAKQIKKVATAAGIDADSDDLARRLAITNVDIPAGRSRSRTDRDTTQEEES